MEYDRRYPCKMRGFGENVGTDLRVLLHQRPFFVIQLARFKQYGIGDSYLADIVEMRSNMHFLSFLFRQPKLMA